MIFWLCLFSRYKTFCSKWWVNIYYFYFFGILLLSHFFSFTCHVLGFLNIFHFLSKQLIRRICFMLIQLHLQQSRFQQMSESIISKNILSLFSFVYFMYWIESTCNLSLYGGWEAWENGINLLSLCNVVSFILSLGKSKIVLKSLYFLYITFYFSIAAYASCVVRFVAYIVQYFYSCYHIWYFLNHISLDEMGNRIDELEHSINDLRAEMGQEGSPSPSAPLKLKDEPKSADDSA